MHDNFGAFISIMIFIGLVVGFIKLVILMEHGPDESSKKNQDADRDALGKDSMDRENEYQAYYSRGPFDD
ncbi:hypothetical protein [Thioalkalivibrio sp. ALE19]|uniref:hypothetical protein n=1 Tax=Thioalkalivibrio sp. ALE19 TaxID=1266909 RepID=UPI0003FE1785|nr:hypothetical protein [Thioalkalivibrio sp. ALE19]